MDLQGGNGAKCWLRRGRGKTQLSGSSIQKGVLRGVKGNVCPGMLRLNFFSGPIVELYDVAETAVGSLFKGLK